MGTNRRTEPLSDSRRTEPLSDATYPQTRTEAEQEWPGLKDGRCCETYGHHWVYYYGGSYCRHCEIDAPSPTGRDY